MNAANETPTRPGVLLTVEEAARAMAVGRTTVYGLLADGTLRSVKIGRLRRIPVQALHEFVHAMAADCGRPAATSPGSPSSVDAVGSSV